MAITIYPITANFAGIDSLNFKIDIGETDWSTSKDISTLVRLPTVLPPDT
jgi:hypothetical protein